MGGGMSLATATDPPGQNGQAVRGVHLTSQNLFRWTANPKRGAVNRAKCRPVVRKFGENWQNFGEMLCNNLQATLTI